jgi:hypothetical protein
MSVVKGSGPGSDAKYALDVMNLTEMKELPAKFNSGAMGRDPETVVVRAYELMNYPKNAYYNSHKSEFSSANWEGVLADYFYNILIPQINPEKRAGVQTQVDKYMVNNIKGKLLPQLQGPSTAPLPPAVSLGTAAPTVSNEPPTQAPATQSNMAASPIIKDAVPVITNTKEVSSNTAALPPVPRQPPPPPQMPRPALEPTYRNVTIQKGGSAPAPVQRRQQRRYVANVPVRAPAARTIPPPARTIPPPTAPLPTKRELTNDEKKTAIDNLTAVLSPNSLIDMEELKRFIATLPGDFFNAVNVYVEDYFTKTNAQTLQFIDTLYRLYKPFEAKYYAFAGQNPKIPFEQTFKIYIITISNDAVPTIRYQPSQIASLRNSIKNWIPPANRVAAQPKLNTNTYPAAATPSYYTQTGLDSLATSIRRTIREQLGGMKIVAGVESAPTTQRNPEVSPSLMQGLNGIINRAGTAAGALQRAKNKGCPNCYPTPWTPDNIPFNPNDYIRKDKIPCANCRL